MILFAADHHYKTHAGRVLYERLRPHYEIDFHEDNWSCFESEELTDRYNLLVLNMISGCCKVPMPGPQAEQNVRRYLEQGGHLLLLHGASAAFWQWDWWRAMAGFRWVRPHDPDGFDRSTHPVVPYRLKPAKTRHPLAGRLQAIDMPVDELYTGLEQTCPTVTLMQAESREGACPQCYACRTPWNGIVLGYLPGHSPDVVRLEPNVANCRILIDDLLSRAGRTS